VPSRRQTVFHGPRVGQERCGLDKEDRVTKRNKEVQSGEKKINPVRGGGTGKKKSPLGIGKKRIPTNRKEITTEGRTKKDRNRHARHRRRVPRLGNKAMYRKQWTRKSETPLGKQKSGRKKFSFRQKRPAGAAFYRELWQAKNSSEENVLEEEKWPQK